MTFYYYVVKRCRVTVKTFLGVIAVALEHCAIYSYSVWIIVLLYDK